MKKPKEMAGRLSFYIFLHHFHVDRRVVCVGHRCLGLGVNYFARRLLCSSRRRRIGVVQAIVRLALFTCWFAGRFIRESTVSSASRFPGNTPKAVALGSDTTALVFFLAASSGSFAASYMLVCKTWQIYIIVYLYTLICICICICKCKCICICTCTCICICICICIYTHTIDYIYAYTCIFRLAILDTKTNQNHVEHGSRSLQEVFRLSSMIFPDMMPPKGLSSIISQ